MTTAVADPRSGGSGAQAVAASARQLVKAYGSGETRVVALDHVDVDIARGAFTAIMGPSGSGKSTLMHCLAGLDSVTEGRIRIGEQEITGLKDKKLTKLRRDRIGFIFQAYNLLPTLNALENITLPMDIAGRKPDKQWLETVIATVGLEDRLKHRPTQLSGGQQQRVAVARALAARPEIIFGDEPTGNLDSRAGAEMLGFLRRSVDELGQTIVMVTHDPVAAAYADRVLYLADGRIVDEMYRPTAEAVLDKMLRLAESTDPGAVAQSGAAPAAGPAGRRTPDGLEAFGTFDDGLEDRRDGSGRGVDFDAFGTNGSRP
ncbi:ABC transporter ATP-binding protein [Streptomyces bathyalis]|uniref:ABC transporter ATP-binding protein n=1 Tax=Streptomyces bathyalis TaxID=2710756 RepID=A0A7T1WRV0_9ACTN|nr:ABC transporter ATP-binding protein [Streptomyces bathyalis]QPP08468.1 ABC transporter ATP-binding protein [Streptomyces bathyalis]